MGIAFLLKKQARYPGLPIHETVLSAASTM